jgi:hypothetical protein
LGCRLLLRCRVLRGAVAACDGSGHHVGALNKLLPVRGPEIVSEPRVLVAIQATSSRTATRVDSPTAAEGARTATRGLPFRDAISFPAATRSAPGPDWLRSRQTTGSANQHGLRDARPGSPALTKVPFLLRSMLRTPRRRRLAEVGQCWRFGRIARPSQSWGSGGRHAQGYRGSGGLMLWRSGRPGLFAT